MNDADGRTVYATTTGSMNEPVAADVRTSFFTGIPHVAWLRQKIEPNPRRPQYLLTVHGLGYKFVG